MQKYIIIIVVCVYRNITYYYYVMNARVLYRRFSSSSPSSLSIHTARYLSVILDGIMRIDRPKQS